MLSVIDKTTVVRHTPGPWETRYGEINHYDGFSVSTTNATAKRVKMVAECWPCTIVDQAHRLELLANARLIAAAPELLEVLRDLTDSVDAVSRAGYVGFDLIAKARAAIAKAEGDADADE